MQKNGAAKWGQISLVVDGEISAKQCRDRWVNFLDPAINLGPWTEEEDRILRDEHQRLGNKWALIKEKLPGRSDNMLKKRWEKLSGSKKSGSGSRKRNPVGDLINGEECTGEDSRKNASDVEEDEYVLDTRSNALPKMKKVKVKDSMDSETNVLGAHVSRPLVSALPPRPSLPLDEPKPSTAQQDEDEDVCDMFEFDLNTGLDFFGRTGLTPYQNSVNHVSSPWMHSGMTPIVGVTLRSSPGIMRIRKKELFSPANQRVLPPTFPSSTNSATNPAEMTPNKATNPVSNEAVLADFASPSVLPFFQTPKTNKNSGNIDWMTPANQNQGNNRALNVKPSTVKPIIVPVGQSLTRQFQAINQKIKDTPRRTPDKMMGPSSVPYMPVPLTPFSGRRGVTLYNGDRENSLADEALLMIRRVDELPIFNQAENYLMNHAMAQSERTSQHQHYNNMQGCSDLDAVAAAAIIHSPQCKITTVDNLFSPLGLEINMQ